MKQHLVQILCTCFMLCSAGWQPIRALTPSPFSQESEAGRALASWKRLSTQELIAVLDGIVTDTAPYILRRQQMIDSLSRKLNEVAASDSASFLYALKLLRANIGFNTREVVRYAQICTELAQKMGDPQRQQQATLAKVRALIQRGQYDQAEQLLLAQYGKVLADNLRDYYEAAVELYGWKGQYVTSEKEQLRYYLQSRCYRDSLLMVEHDPVWRVHQRCLLMSVDSVQLPEAVGLIRSALDTLPVSHPHIRHLSYTASYLYSQAHRPDSAEYYLAVSALHDLTEGVREYVSLRDLALRLFQQRDLSRAYHYLHRCVQDANASEVPLRMLQCSPEFPVILDAYQQKIDAQSRDLRLRLLAFVLLSAVLVVLLVYVYYVTVRLRQSRRKLWEKRKQLEENNRKLNEVLDQEQEANLQLRESNRIKEAYITQYMTECSAFIDKIMAYRKGLLGVAQGKKVAELLSLLRDTEVEKQELDNFYNHFDHTFLQLFPCFVEQLNALLQPDARILPHGDQPRLNTDLRVFALIRLGITDSATIASFLHCSVKTVYNCRARLRSKALCERNDFEEQIKQLK